MEDGGHYRPARRDPRARHDGFERIVFEFEGADPPGNRVGYLDPPVREDFSGNPVEVAGNAFLEIRLVSGAGFDPMSDDARKTYTGTLHFTPAGTEVLEKRLVVDVVLAADPPDQRSVLVSARSIRGARTSRA